MSLSELVLFNPFIWVSISMYVNNGTAKVPISAKIGVRVQQPTSKIWNSPGTIYTFCNKCGRWNSGVIHQYSDYHKSKEEKGKLKYSAGHILDTNDDKPPGKGRLNLMGSLFLGSVQKTTGTKFTSDPTDYRISISYSGTES